MSILTGKRETNPSHYVMNGNWSRLFMRIVRPEMILSMNSWWEFLWEKKWIDVKWCECKNGKCMSHARATPITQLMCAWLWNNELFLRISLTSTVAFWWFSFEVVNSTQKLIKAQVQSISGVGKSPPVHQRLGDTLVLWFYFINARRRTSHSCNEKTAMIQHCAANSMSVHK